MGSNVELKSIQSSFASTLKVPGRTSSPTRQQNGSNCTNSQKPKRSYEKFKFQLENQPIVGTVTGLLSPNEKFLSGNLQCESRKPIQKKETNKDEKEYTYVMVFSREFNSAEFEFIEMERNAYENAPQYQPKISVGNYVVCAPVLPHQIYWRMEPAYNMYYPPNPYFCYNYVHNPYAYYNDPQNPCFCNKNHGFTG